MRLAADIYINLVRVVSNILGAVAAALLSLAILVIIHMIFVRYVLGEPTVWQTEWVIYAVVAATFVGSPYVLLQKGHISVDLLLLVLGDRARNALELVALLLSLAFSAALLYYSATWWYEAFHLGWTSDTIARIPLWIPYLSLPLGMAGLVLQFVADLITRLRGEEAHVEASVYGTGAGEPVSKP